MSDTPAGKRYRVIKMVEVRRLNPKSGIPLTEPPTSLPFGALLLNVREERDLYKFEYLGKPYQCVQHVLAPAMEPFGDAAPKPQFEEEEADAPITAEAEPVYAPPPPPAPVAAAADAPFQWETLATSHGALLRARVPGGWLLMGARGAALVFYPDAKHAWDGATLAAPEPE